MSFSSLETFFFTTRDPATKLAPSTRNGLSDNNNFQEAGSEALFGVDSATVGAFVIDAGRAVAMATGVSGFEPASAPISGGGAERSMLISSSGSGPRSTS